MTGLPDLRWSANTGDPQAHLASKLSDSGPRWSRPRGRVRQMRATQPSQWPGCRSTATPNCPSTVMKLGCVDLTPQPMLRPFGAFAICSAARTTVLCIPLGNNGMPSCCEGVLYTKLFDDSCRDLLDKPEPTKLKLVELVGRVQYLALATAPTSAAEAMVTSQGKTSDEESCQVFVLSPSESGSFSNEPEGPSVVTWTRVQTFKIHTHERKSDRLTLPAHPTSKHNSDMRIQPEAAWWRTLTELSWTLGHSTEKKWQIVWDQNGRTEIKKQDTEKSKNRQTQSSIKTQSETYRSSTITTSTSSALPLHRYLQHSSSPLHLPSLRKKPKPLKIARKRKKVWGHGFQVPK